MGVKKEKTTTRTLITDLHSGTSIFSETRIEERDDWNPHCVLPENYFDFALAREGVHVDGVPLSINSWDGREIMSVIRRH